jgi:hypothetical protein
VAIVPQWDEVAITPSKMADWHARLTPQFDQPELRRSALDRLTLDYWWGQICAADNLQP